MQSFSQAGQDTFVYNILKKKNGFFIDIGASDFKFINNTFFLEKFMDWKGILIERDDFRVPNYEKYRTNSSYIINDATKINYKNLFEEKNLPINIDYLSIDVEVDDGSTLQTLKKLDNEVMDKYKFATLTFEHDIYRNNFADTRIKSREILKKRGYIPVFTDVLFKDFGPVEDWYVHPELVDMNYINHLLGKNKKNYIDFTTNYVDNMGQKINCIPSLKIEY